MEVGLRVDLSKLSKGLKDVQRQQLPFATAQMLTAVAGHVGIAWQGEMESELDRPTPFTLNSVSVKPARKSAPVATVFVKDIAAEYLRPYVDGGPRSLGQKKGLLTPKGVTLNKYGNIPARKIAQLKAKPNVFVGPVKLKSGQVVNGVWQRNPAKRGQRRAGGYGSKGSHNVKHNEGMGLSGHNNRTTLKLLVRFSDPEPPKQRLALEEVAKATVLATAQPEFAKALAQALRTAR